MADDRLACLRPPSIAPTNAVTVTPRSSAISLKLFQNSSSRLILVLWPAMMIERFKTGDTASTPPRMSQRYYIDRMIIWTRKTLDLGPPANTEVSPWRYGPPGFKVREAMRRLLLSVEQMSDDGDAVGDGSVQEEPPSPP